MPLQDHTLSPLPSLTMLETVPVLKALATASRALAELKGGAATIPNQGILIDTLTLQEAKASSEIENIVTTQDELFQASLFPGDSSTPATKEVAHYSEALKLGYKRMREMGDLITNNTLIEMYRLLKMRDDGFRVTPGVLLKNEQTGETVYTPPQDPQEIVILMTALEQFINKDEESPLDPLIKMALIHHRFESIHPFSDGNGRVGRILNVLYLARMGLLNIPILYLSRHIIQTKEDYYRLLRAVQGTGDVGQAWKDWVIYMLAAVAGAAETTLELVDGIRGQMEHAKHRMREQLPRIYSQDLLDNLFRHPYTRIEFVGRDLNVTRQTATKYLDLLNKHGFVEKHRVGRRNYYINNALVQLLIDVSERTVTP